GRLTATRFPPRPAGVAGGVGPSDRFGAAAPPQPARTSTAASSHAPRPPRAKRIDTDRSYGVCEQSKTEITCRRDRKGGGTMGRAMSALAAVCVVAAAISTTAAAPATTTGTI